MANRYNTQFPLAFEKKVVNIYAQVTFGATGAPTLNVVNSKGVVSVTRNSTGDFTFVFGTQVKMLDVYVKFLSAKVTYNSGASAPLAPGMYIKANNIATFNTASIELVLNAAGTPTDPASGEIGYFEFIFGDSTAP